MGVRYRAEIETLKERLAAALLTGPEVWLKLPATLAS